MKNYMYVIALLSISFMSTDINSFPKLEIPSIPGISGDKPESESTGNPADAAAKLESDLRSALISVARADELIKLAYGDKDGAAQAAARADKLNDGGDVKGAIEETKSSAIFFPISLKAYHIGNDLHSDDLQTYSYVNDIKIKLKNTCNINSEITHKISYNLQKFYILLIN